MTQKEQFLQKLNEAFAQSDTEYLLDQVTEDITWNIVGDKTIQGKAAFEADLKSMESVNTYELDIANVITHGKSASVNGTMKMKTPEGTEHTYAFCDIYTFNGFKNAKIKEMTSYVIEVK